MVAGEVWIVLLLLNDDSDVLFEGDGTELLAGTGKIVVFVYFGVVVGRL